MQATTAKKKVDVKKLNVGDVFSESQHYILTKVDRNTGEVELKNDATDELITVTGDYVEVFLDSADQSMEEKVVNKTEAAGILLSHPFTAMTVSFNKQVKHEDIAKEVMEAYESSRPNEFADKMKKAVKKGSVGEERIITGHHFGKQDEYGRVNFVDFKLPKDTSKDYDTRLRLVDTRSINWIIVKGTKYKVK